MPQLSLNTMCYMAKDFDRLMQAARVLKQWDTQAEVARKLAVDDQIMTNWKARGVPKQRIIEIARKIGCNPFWLEDGEGEMLMYSKTDMIAIAISQQLSAEERKVWYRIGNTLSESTQDTDHSTNHDIPNHKTITK
jgi:hypothetical protein